MIVASPPSPWPTFREVIRGLRGRGDGVSLLASRNRRRLYHFDGNAAQLQILPTHRPVRYSDAPETEVVVATWWETAEWADRNFPADMPKFYLIQHYEPKFPMVPEERAEATWRMPLQKVVISQWLAELAQDKFHDPSRILIPNSVDTDQFHAPARGKQSVPTVGMLYSSVPWKGCNVSLKALEICRRTFPDVRLVAFGAAPAPETLPPGSRYVQTPPQEEIRNLYAQCDVWLCGSYGEGFHLPPSEAMACRCPVVSTKVGGPLDLIQDGVNGYLVDVGDSEALARRLVDILSLDDANWRDLSDAAYKTVVDYTWDDATDLFEAALLRAVEAKQAGQPV